MIPLIGELCATLAALCYGFSSVAVTKNARAGGGRGGAVLLSIMLTAAFSGGLWLVIGPALPPAGAGLWAGIAVFALAGILATVLGRLFYFRSIELTSAIEVGLTRRLIPVFAAGLAVLFLGEVITAGILLAFLFVFSGVAISFIANPNHAAASSPHTPRTPADQLKGRALSVASSASYGGAYVTRKIAMTWLPDPLAGAFIGAVTGMVWYAVAAPFSAGYRDSIRSLFHKPGRWHVLAAAAISLGQILQFVALTFTSVTAVAIIGSIEMFFAAWLAAFVFKTEPRPGAAFILASLLAFAGVALLALSRMGP